MLLQCPSVSFQARSHWSPHRRRWWYRKRCPRCPRIPARLHRCASTTAPRPVSPRDHSTPPNTLQVSHPTNDTFPCTSSIAHARNEKIRHDERNTWFGHWPFLNFKVLSIQNLIVAKNHENCIYVLRVWTCSVHFVNFYVTLILCALIFVLFCVFSYLWNELGQFLGAERFHFVKTYV